MSISCFLIDIDPISNILKIPLDEDFSARVLLHIFKLLGARFWNLQKQS